MSEKKFRYGNIFTYSSLQFSGNLEEYFAKHAKKLVVFLIMPRLKNKDNLVRLYKEGKLIKEEKVQLSDNIFLYYFLWLLNYWRIIFSYLSFNEKIISLSFHPISLFGISLQKMFRHITFVFWIGDYFPPTNLSLTIYQRVKQFYHDRIDYTCYLGDGINKKMNGRIVDTNKRKTVMWGVKPKHLKRKLSKNNFVILFVGVVKESQGIEHIFSFLKENNDCFLNIIGICDAALYKKYKKIIKEYKIEKQIFFPNKFFSDNELNKLSQKSHVGIAIYDTDPNNPTYYTDPGKVKAYVEMGLPVIMSDVSAVSEYIKKYHSGEVIAQDTQAVKKAIAKIKKNYHLYEKGVKAMTDYFYYENYYEKKLKFLEKLK